MEYSYYSFLVLTILMFFNNSKAMESIDTKISNQPIQLDGTLNLFHQNNIKYISFEDMNPIIKGLYQRYFIPECIPVIPIEIDLKNSFYNEKYKKKLREGIPLSLLAPLFDRSENNPVVDFMIDNFKFKLQPKHKSLVINILTGFEADFVKKSDIELGLVNQENLIAKKIISFNSTLFKKYSHGENGYPAFKENSFFHLCAIIRKIVDNQHQPCKECLQKDERINILTESISSLLTLNRENDSETKSLKEQIILLKSQPLIEKQCDQCEKKNIEINFLTRQISSLEALLNNEKRLKEIVQKEYDELKKTAPCDECLQKDQDIEFFKGKITFLNKQIDQKNYEYENIATNRKSKYIVTRCKSVE